MLYALSAVAAAVMDVCEGGIEHGYMLQHGKSPMQERYVVRRCFGRSPSSTYFCQGAHVGRGTELDELNGLNGLNWLDGVVNRTVAYFG